MVDPRDCALCHKNGERPQHEEGRLLSVYEYVMILLHPPLSTIVFLIDFSLLLLLYSYLWEKIRFALSVSDSQTWIHIQCAIWSAEVYESSVGVLSNVSAAVIRGKSQVWMITEFDSCRKVLLFIVCGTSRR
jgi:hypothetical protein